MGISWLPSLAFRYKRDSTEEHSCHQHFSNLTFVYQFHSLKPAKWPLLYSKPCTGSSPSLLSPRLSLRLAGPTLTRSVQPPAHSRMQLWPDITISVHSTALPLWPGVTNLRMPPKAGRPDAIGGTLKERLGLTEVRRPTESSYLLKMLMFGLAENLAAGGGDFTVTDAINLWTAEVKDYDPQHPTYSHFTQVVWKATTEVGCAVATCSGKMLGWGDVRILSPTFICSSELWMPCRYRFSTLCASTTHMAMLTANTSAPSIFHPTESTNSHRFIFFLPAKMCKFEAKASVVRGVYQYLLCR